MKAAVLWMAPLLAHAAPAAAQAPVPEAQQPVFRSGVDLVELRVTVTDREQNYVTGLRQQDFLVFEDGVQQMVTFFASADVPLDMLLLVDTSASMHGQMAIVREAAAGFVAKLSAADRGSVVEFNNTVQVLQEFTGDRARLLDAIDRLHPRGATALHNALYIALKEFERLARQQDMVRRQAIVLLSDGDDTASLIGFDEVMELAKRIGVSIYTIFLQPEYLAQQFDGGRRLFSQAQFAMRSLAQETGAQSFTALRARDLAGVYAAVARDLANQYALGYASSNPRPDGQFRRIVVRVAERPDVRARARAGYYAETPSTTGLGGP